MVLGLACCYLLTKYGVTAAVKAKAQDRQGSEIRLKGEEVLAQALEHETDHLDGTLYIDHIESPDKLQKLTQQL